MLDFVTLIKNADKFNPIDELGRVSWPFSGMAIGDSVLIPNEFAKRAQQAASTHSSQSTAKLLTRTLTSGQLLVVRKS